MGYKDPPEHSRFQKGQSGNPKGRPKKQQDPVMTKYDFEMLEVFDSAVPIKEQGVVKMMNSVKAVSKAQLVKALSGDAMAQRDYLKRADILGQQRQQKQQQERAFWQDYIDGFDALCRSYTDKGQELPKDLIYPEDITFYADGRVKVIDRYHPALIRACEYTVKLRDYYALRAEYCRRLWRKEGINKDFSPCEVAYHVMLNGCLPLHCQQSEAQQEEALDEAMAMRMPSLKRRLKFLYKQLDHYDPLPHLPKVEAEPLAPSDMTAEQFLELLYKAKEKYDQERG